MSNTNRDPGYGDPLAPIGTVEWAKRWRLTFQSVAQDLPRSPQSCCKFYKVGVETRAWTLVTDKDGKTFADFDSFCSASRPWGLGMDPKKLKAYLGVEIGGRAVELMAVAPDGRADNGANQHTGPKVDSPHGEGNPQEPSKKPPGHAKEERLRAILRAPEIVQELYKEGWLTQETAVKLGPKDPTPEQAAKVAEVREKIEELERPKKEPDKTPDPEKVAKFRKDVAKIVQDTLGSRQAASTPTALELLRRAWTMATEEERATFITEITSD